MLVTNKNTGIGRDRATRAGAGRRGPRGSHGQTLIIPPERMPPLEEGRGRLVEEGAERLLS